MAHIWECNVHKQVFANNIMVIMLYVPMDFAAQHRFKINAQMEVTIWLGLVPIIKFAKVILVPPQFAIMETVAPDLQSQIVAPIIQLFSADNAQIIKHVKVFTESIHSVTMAPVVQPLHQ
uniref:Uncharacterized protein n=1 Tax=Panagrolaimus superbus TaxID=310955 RepID=A0A914YT39_9BILA